MRSIAQYSSNPDYLLAKAICEWTAENAKRLIDESKTEAAQTGHLCILFDLSNWLKPDLEFTRFVSGEYLAKELLPPFEVAAFASAAAINRLGENTAVNRGAWFRIFDDKQAAIQWLVE